MTATELVQTLSWHVASPTTEAAADDFVHAPALEDRLDALYPVAVRHRTLLAVASHLARADRGRGNLTVAADVVGASWPLSNVLPTPDASGTRVPLIALGERAAELDRRHLDLCLELARRRPGVPIILHGRAIQALHSEYVLRVTHDADLMTRDPSDAFVLAADLTELGFTLARAREVHAAGRRVTYAGLRRTDADGYRLHFDILGGGRLWARGGVPPSIDVTEFGRCRAVFVEGVEVLVPSPADTLVHIAVKKARTLGIVRRDHNDARVLMIGLEPAIDWDVVASRARREHVGPHLHALICDAERAEGRTLAPVDVVCEFAPNRIERRLLALSASMTPNRPRDPNDRVSPVAWSVERALRTLRLGYYVAAHRGQPRDLAWLLAEPARRVTRAHRKRGFREPSPTASDRAQVHGSRTS
jgi:hypothetical protein